MANCFAIPSSRRPRPRLFDAFPVVSSGLPSLRLLTVLSLFDSSFHRQRGALASPGRLHHSLQDDDGYIKETARSSSWMGTQLLAFCLGKTLSRDYSLASFKSRSSRADDLGHYCAVKMDFTVRSLQKFPFLLVSS